MNIFEKFVRIYEEEQRFVVFDVETAGPYIVEIGAIEAGKLYGEKCRSFQKILQFRPPSWKPYWRELSIHNIPSVEIENGEDRVAVFGSFLKFIEGATLICHTSFDIRASLTDLRRHKELAYALELPAWKEFFDSRCLAREAYPGLSSYALGALAKYFQIKNPQAHRALADAWTTKKMLAKLLLWHYSH